MENQFLFTPLPAKISGVYVKLRSHPQKHDTNKKFKAILEIPASRWQILRLGYMANTYLKGGWYDNLFRTSAIIPSVYNLRKMYWGDIEWRGYWRTDSIEMNTFFVTQTFFDKYRWCHLFWNFQVNLFLAILAHILDPLVSMVRVIILIGVWRVRRLKEWYDSKMILW